MVRPAAQAAAFETVRPGRSIHVTALEPGPFRTD
jgi:hypothetical protein